MNSSSDLGQLTLIKRIFRKIESFFTTEKSRELSHWRNRDYSEPSPHFVKMNFLIQNGLPGAIWIETGTYLGQTTEVLSRVSKRVITIEPSKHLYAAAVLKFEGNQIIQLVNDMSENAFPQILPEIHEPVNFWLDGHFSSGNTFQGPKNTPIAEELSTIAKYINNFGKVAVFIDDIRLFGKGNQVNHGYPPLDLLVDWARANSLEWAIEHDIFVARSSNSERQITNRV